MAATEPKRRPMTDMADNQTSIDELTESFEATDLAATTAAPAFFRGRAAARTSAAAISYMVAHANHSVSADGPLTAGELLKQFGVTSVGQRTHQFRKLLGLPADPEHGVMLLAAPDYLVSLRRAQLITEYQQLE